jgi:hypothetical protein
MRKNIVLMLLLFTGFSAQAKDIVQEKSIGMELARDLANQAIMAWTDSGLFREARRDIQQEMNHIDGLIVMEGGIKIIASGYNLVQSV